jgi:hypothetical protein
MRIGTSALVLVLTAALFGCGPDSRASPMEPVETDPPRVLSVSPANGAINVAVRSGVTIIFSEPVHPTSVTSSTLFLTPEVAGAFTVSGATVIFVPSDPLTEGTVYTARVTTGVVDMVGNPLAAAHEWSFTTGGSRPIP